MTLECGQGGPPVTWECWAPLHLRVDLCEGYSGACLPVDQAPQPGLALDDAVGNPHLAAQGRQEDHELEDSISSRLIWSKSSNLKRLMW